MHVVIITDRREALGEFARGLGKDVEWTASAADVLDRAPASPWQLVVVDAAMSGMDYRKFLLDLLRVNAMLNTVVVTDMGEEDFHEHSEGLGVLCSVPASPSWDDGVGAMDRLCRLYGLG